MEFKTMEGADCLVNIDLVALAVPSEDGGYLLLDAERHILACVPKDCFELAVRDGGGETRLASRIDRLIQALDRLAVRIPASVRMHF